MQGQSTYIVPSEPKYIFCWWTDEHHKMILICCTHLHVIRKYVIIASFSRPKVLYHHPLPKCLGTHSTASKSPFSGSKVRFIESLDRKNEKLRSLDEILFEDQKPLPLA